MKRILIMLCLAGALPAAAQDYTLYTNQSNSGTTWYLEVKAQRNNAANTARYVNTTIKLQFSSNSGLDFNNSNPANASSGWTDLTNGNYLNATISKTNQGGVWKILINYNGAPGSWADCVDWPASNTLKIVRISMPIYNTSAPSGVSWDALCNSTSAYVMNSGNNQEGNERCSMSVFNFTAPDGGFGLPVELVSFTAALRNEAVCLRWKTATEVNNYGFEIQRKFRSAEAWQRLDFVPGGGTVNDPRSYEYFDRPADLLRENGRLERIDYRLRQIDRDGRSEFSNTVSVSVVLPSEAELDQNFPNPFQGGTTVSYRLPADRYCRVLLYDAFGRMIRILSEGFRDKGFHAVAMKRGELPPGTYFYTLETGGDRLVRSMTIIQ